MPELLLELLSEEIPARMQKRAASDLHRLVCGGLKKAGLGFYSAHAYVTPRRLTLVVAGLPEKQPDIEEEQKGPRVSAPEHAINGFLGSLGGLTLGDCEQREVKGKTFWFAVIDKKGEPTRSVLEGILEQALTSMADTWPKSMRWGKNTVRWARPLYSILCLIDGTVIPVSFGPLTASDTTYGHRFHSLKKFAVKDFDEYRRKILANKVMLDPAERREKIRVDAETLAKDAGLNVKSDEALLDEVAGLVEWPVTLMGDIDAEFMNVPPEVLIAAMRGHQKYFSCLDADGNLAGKFIFVSNIEAAGGGAAIIAGNERVLRARLSDTKFFWDQDRRQGLESRLPKLAGVVFHAKLGLVLEKVDRIKSITKMLTSNKFVKANSAHAYNAAKLCKADLVTGMVGELPELQGLMGKYYALETGQHQDTADAISEHYSPVGPNDECPTKPCSVVVALSDKIDTLVGFFAIDEKPSGSKDPFALRRAALGVIRLILENSLRLPLRVIFLHGYNMYPLAYQEKSFAHPKDVVAADLLAFFADRLKVHLKEKGVRHDLIDAVFSLGEDDLVRVLVRVHALGAFLSTDDGVNLLAAYKRAANILKIEEKKDGRLYNENLNPSLQEEDDERALFDKLMEVGPKISTFIKDEEYSSAMSELASARPEIDAFFDNVKVNSNQPKLRENRLNMLSYIRRALEEVADFSRIEG